MTRALTDIGPLSCVASPDEVIGVLGLIHDRDRFEAGSRWPGCLAVVSS
jgi:hypothetical protein